MTDEEARFSARRRKYPGTPYTPAQARLLIELAQREASTVADLRRAVDIDLAYLYRILAKFESDGLITSIRKEAGLTEIIRLTGSGHAAVAGLDPATERKTMHVSSNSGEARIAELLAEYGQVKFGSQWDPPDGLPWELHRYGEEAFGDEWWPGSPWAYLGRERGDELCRLLGAETSDQVASAAEW